MSAPFPVKTVPVSEPKVIAESVTSTAKVLSHLQDIVPKAQAVLRNMEVDIHDRSFELLSVDIRKLKATVSAMSAVYALLEAYRRVENATSIADNL